MLRSVVNSSSLRSIGYEARKSILEVEFVNGHVYQYLDVPHEVYEGLSRSKSKGRYFHDHIRDSFDSVQVN